MQNFQIPSSVVVRRSVAVNSIKTVMVKFFFTNPAHIPVRLARAKSLRPKLATDSDTFNAIVATGQGRPELAEVGRVRPGRVDTGVQVVDNLQFVQLGLIRRGLTNVGFQLHDAYSFFIPHKRKHVVVLVFEKGYYEEATATDEEKRIHNLLNSRDVVEALRALGRTTWQWCHVWDNREIRQTATINVGGKLPDEERMNANAIVVRDGQIIAVDIPVQLQESEE